METRAQKHVCNTIRMLHVPSALEDISRSFEDDSWARRVTVS